MPLRQSLRLVVALAAFGLMPSAASAACVAAPTTKAFAKVGDNADYSVAPGGGFEAGSPAWTLTGGRKVVSGNESLGWFQGSVLAGSRSLALPVGATATSPEFCVDESHPYFRFMAKADSSMSGYDAIVIFRNASGAVTSTQFTSSSDVSWGNGNWGASKVSPLATKIPLAAAPPPCS